MKRPCSRVCLLTIALLLLLQVYVFYLSEPLPLLPEPPEENQTVLLLIWNPPFDKYKRLPDCLKLYRVPECVLTYDDLAYPHADAVIVHHREISIGEADLPPDPRPSTQKWIWMNHESPAHTPRLWYMEGHFNLTLSYRTDSDIFVPYGYLVPRVSRIPGAQPLLTPTGKALLRPRLLAWVISNWSPSHARVSFYYKLRRYLRVDVFGDAGMPLPRDFDGHTVIELVERYQFYLALENSQYTDYITEKLWNALVAGAIPVVLGPSRQSYERFLPAEAFIHVDDFPTVRSLARYLVQLRRNPSRLRKHLAWRDKYSVHQPVFWDEHYCTACRAVRKNLRRTTEVTDLTGWFFS